MNKVKQILLFVFLLAGLSANAQKSATRKLDSVKVNGAYFYVYPYLQSVTATPDLLRVATKKEMAVLRTEMGDLAIEPLLYNDEGYDYYLEQEATTKVSKTRTKMLRKYAKYNYILYQGESRELVPALDVLPDGNYVQYFQKYWHYNEKDELVVEKQQVAGYFTLKNNLLEGNARWVNLTGDTVKYGRYSQGLKEGEWLSNEFSTDNIYFYIGTGSFNTGPDVVVKNNYANGVLNGLTESRTGNGFLVSRGQYKDGQPTGEWFEYTITPLQTQKGEWRDSSVLIKHYTLSEQKLISRKPYIRTMFNSGDLPFKYYSFPENDFSEPVMFQGFWKINLPETDNIELPEEGMNSYDGEEYEEMESYYRGNDYYGDRQEFLWIDGKYLPTGKVIDSIGLINLYQGVYEEFWENGALKLRFRFENGELMKEDTIFWDNGKPADVVVFDPVEKQYENRKMDYKGVLYEVDIFDSLGTFVKQTLDPYYKDKHILIDGLDAELVEDYLYLGMDEDGSMEWNTFSYDRSDTLKNLNLSGKIVLTKTWYGDTSVWQSNVYDADARTITEETRSLNGTLIKSAVMEYDENFDNVRGTYTVKVGELEMKETSNGGFNAAYAIGMSDSFPAVRTQLPHLYELTEDRVLNYKNQPFTGKVSAKLDAKSFGLSAQKNEVKISVTNSGKFLSKLVKDYENYLKTGKTKYPEILSMATRIEEDYFNELMLMIPELGFIFSANSKGYQPGTEVMDVVKISGSYLNGKPNGSWKSFDSKGKTVLECTYLNGELDGTIKMYSYAHPRNYKKKKKKSKKNAFDFNYEDYTPEPSRYDTLPAKTVYYNSTKINIKNGQLHGDLITYNWQGKVKSKVNYVNGYPEGPAFEHNAVASTFLNFEDGQIDGIVKTYLHLPGKDSILLYELNYQNGSLQGESRSYHTNGKLSKRGFFLGGMPIDDYEAYDSLGTRFHYVKFQYSFPVEEKIWEANQLSVRYQFDWRDSIYFKPSDITQTTSVDNLMYQYGLLGDVYSMPYLGRPSLVEKTGIDYHMTKYFPNDTVSRDGELSSGKKVGNWKFYSYEGEKLYEVDYRDTLIKLNDSIQFKAKGMHFDYDAKGNLLSKSWIIEKFEKYDCSHTDHYEVRQFYTIWQAHDSLHRINGYVKNYYDNGVIQSEGNMKDGLPAGVWKYYDPFGKLNHVGEYKLGKRDGRWLSGDLSKSKYLGDICMNPNLPNLEEQMKYQEKMLDIYIRYFKMGKLLNSEYYDLNLNDYEDELAAPEEEEGEEH